MKENNGLREGSFKPPANTVSIFCDVRTADKSDNNGALLPHAQGSMGVFYGTPAAFTMLGERNTDFANQLFEREIQHFPANKSPYLFYLIGERFKKEEAEKYMADLEMLIRQSANFKTERELIIAKNISQTLGKKEDAERLAAEI